MGEREGESKLDQERQREKKDKETQREAETEKWRDYNSLAFSWVMFLI